MFFLSSVMMSWSKIFKSKKVLITGGLGFIGSNLARTLVNAGADVTLIDSLIPSYGGSLYNIGDIKTKVNVFKADIREEKKLPRFIKGQDFLFNLAGQTSHWDSMTDPAADLDINCRAQLSLLEACKKHNPKIRIVFASTRQIYGRPDALPVKETHPLRPVDINGINKVAGESFHLLYAKIHGMSTCALRLTNTIGPGMRIKDARQTFVGVWIRDILKGKRFEVWGGDQKRDFTYIDDAVEAFLLAATYAEAKGAVYNLGGPSVTTLRELAETLVEINGTGGFQIRQFPKERAKIDIGDYYADYSLIKRKLGWRPKTDLRSALKQTLEYYRIELKHYL